MKLWLLRHAPVEAPAGLCYGATDFTAEPMATQAAAQRIAALLPAGVTLRSSPLQRCSALAQAVAALRPELGSVEIDPRLGEFNFGGWEGRPWSSIARAEIDAWTADFADFTDFTVEGGGPSSGNGDSVRAFMQRVGAAWDDWRGAQRDALWVTHAGVVRAVGLLAQGVRCPGSAAEWPTQEIAPGAWLTVEV